MDEKRPTLEHSCKISELWKQVQSLELSEISIMREKEGEETRGEKERKNKTHTGHTPYIGGIKMASNSSKAIWKLNINGTKL